MGRLIVAIVLGLWFFFFGIPLLFGGLLLLLGLSAHGS